MKKKVSRRLVLVGMPFCAPFHFAVGQSTETPALRIPVEKGPVGLDALPKSRTKAAPSKAAHAFSQGRRSVESPEATLPHEESQSVSGREEASAARSLQSVLETSRTASVKRHGGEGGQVSFRLRGARAFEPRYLFEGVPLAASSEGEQALFVLPLSLVGRYRVFPDTPPLGLSGGSAGGVGGSVNFEGCGASCFPSLSSSEKSSLPWGANVSLGLGSFGSAKATLAGALRPTADGTVLAALEHAKARDDFPYTDDGGTLTTRADDVTRRRANNASERFAGGLRVTWRNVPVAGEATLDALGGQEVRGLPGPAVSLSQARTPLRNTDSLTRQFGLAAVRTRTLLPASGIEVRTHAHVTHGKASSQRETAGWRTEANGTGARQGGGLSLLVPWPGDPGGAWGFALDAHRAAQRNETWREQEKQGELKASRTTLAPAVHVSRSGWDRRTAATLDAGVDLTQSRAASECRTRTPGCTRLQNNETEAAERSLFTGSVGLQGRVNTPVETAAYLRVSRTARRPSLGERFGDSGGLLANPALRPEHSTKIETGLLFPYLSAAVYSAQDENLIFASKAGQALQATNLEQGTRLGGFLSVDVPVGQQWTLQGSYHGLRARMHRQGEPEATVPRSPEHSVRGGVAFQSPLLQNTFWVSSLAEAFWQSPFFVDAANLIRFESSVDARAELAFNWSGFALSPGSSVSLLLQGESLLDAAGGRQMLGARTASNNSIAAEHAGFPGFPEPGRRYFVTVKSQF